MYIFKPPVSYPLFLGCSSRPSVAEYPDPRFTADIGGGCGLHKRIPTKDWWRDTPNPSNMFWCWRRGGGGGAGWGLCVTYCVAGGKKTNPDFFSFPKFSPRNFAKLTEDEEEGGSILVAKNTAAPKLSSRISGGHDIFSLHPSAPPPPPPWAPKSKGREGKNNPPKKKNKNSLYNIHVHTLFPLFFVPMRGVGRGGWGEYFWRGGG